MKRFRTALFWAHLAAGVAAGLVILIMSVTGAALTYEKQMLEWADRRAWTAPSPGSARHLAPATLLARVVEAKVGAAPTGVTLRSDPAAPAAVTLAGNASILVDPYTGAVIGPPPQGLRTFFRTMTTWHRYLALEGASRATGKALTGAANLVFLFIVVSGLYLWVPRAWTWLQFKNVLWFRRGLTGKARDFNWHNAIGIWSALPLAIVVAGAVPISYPWGSNLVYRLAGDVPPVAAPPAPRQAPQGAREQPPVVLDGIDAAWSAAAAQVPSWRTIALRLGEAKSPLVFTVDGGYAGQPQKRTTVTVNRGTGRVEKAETFDRLSPGRRARSWLRFAHTGEIYGLTGQTIAGAASAGGAVLVVTGITLAVRRLAAALKRRQTESVRENSRRAA